MTKDIGKAKILSAFLCPGFCWQNWLSGLHEFTNRVCGSEALSTVDEGSQETLKLTGQRQLHGTSWDVSKGTEGADWSHSKAPVNHIQKTVAIGQSFS